MSAAYLQEKGNHALIEITFQSMTLMSNGLVARSPKYLKLYKAKEALQAQFAELFITGRAPV